MEISPHYTVICKNAKKINFFTTTRGSKMCQKLVSNVKFGIGAQKYGVGRNFEFWQKFRILAEISAIFAPYGAFSQKMSENVEKCIFSKLTEIHWFFIFSLKIDFKSCLLRERLDFDNRNMDNFRQKKIIMIFVLPPKFDAEIFHAENNSVVFLMSWCVHIPYFGFLVSTNLSR